MCTHLLAKMESTEEAKGQLASLSISPLLTSKEPFCACVDKEVSWLREREICGLLSPIWAGPGLLPNCPAIFVLECQSTENVPQLCAQRGPSISYLSQVATDFWESQEWAADIWERDFQAEGTDRARLSRKVLAYSGNREEAFVAGVDKQDREK